MIVKIRHDPDRTSVAGRLIEKAIASGPKLSKRLSRSRLGDPDDILSGQRSRNGLILNRRGRDKFHSSQKFQHFGRDAEMIKSDWIGFQKFPPAPSDGFLILLHFGKASQHDRINFCLAF